MAQATRSTLHILIVEPCPTQGRIISRALDHAGVQHLRLVRSGADALALAHCAMPDVMISALHLPDMTTRQLMLQVREYRGPRRVAFVVVSSETRLCYLDPLRQAGAVAILGKPFATRELDLALDAALDLVDDSRLVPRGCELGRHRVLIVDETAQARYQIRMVLQALGFEHVSEATDSRQALSALAMRRFDLIVSDYNMPEMDGCRLVQSIRERNAATPILMVTSNDDHSRLSAVERAGVSAICDKPFAPGHVGALVQRMLRAA